MNYIDVLIKLICLVGIGWIFFWLLNLFTLPQPLRLVVCVIVGIIGILVLADIGGLGHGHLSLR